MITTRRDKLVRVDEVQESMGSSTVVALMTERAKDMFRLLHS